MRISAAIWRSGSIPRAVGKDRGWCCTGAATPREDRRHADLNGDAVDVLCVKGSGWIGLDRARGLPAVRSRRVKTSRARKKLSDEERSAAAAGRPIDRSCAPNPSVEALLHALSRTNSSTHPIPPRCLRSRSARRGSVCREVFGARVGYVPYLMPGFGLAKLRRGIRWADPSVEGLILVSTAFQLRRRREGGLRAMIGLVTLAEKRLPGSAAAFSSGKTAGLPGTGDGRRADYHGACVCRRIKPRALEALYLDFRGNDAVNEFRQRRGSGALWPGRRGNAGPQHPHQELAARGGRCPRTATSKVSRIRSAAPVAA